MVIQMTMLGRHLYELIIISRDHEKWRWPFFCLFFFAMLNPVNWIAQLCDRTYGCIMRCYLLIWNCKFQIIIRSRKESSTSDQKNPWRILRFFFSSEQKDPFPGPRNRGLLDRGLLDFWQSRTPRFLTIEDSPFLNLTDNLTQSDLFIADTAGMYNVTEA